jgi:hypothetical protein
MEWSKEEGTAAKLGIAGHPAIKARAHLES